MDADNSLLTENLSESESNKGLIRFETDNLMDIKEGQLSFSALVRPAEGSGASILAEKPGSWRLTYQDDRTVHLSVWDRNCNAEPVVLKGTRPLHPGTWHRVSFSIFGWDSTYGSDPRAITDATIQLWVDGVPQVDPVIRGVASLCSRPESRLLIGGNLEPGLDSFQGEIYDVDLRMSSLFQDEHELMPVPMLIDSFEPDGTSESSPCAHLTNDCERETSSCGWALQQRVSPASAADEPAKFTESAALVGRWGLAMVSDHPTAKQLGLLYSDLAQPSRHFRAEFFVEPEEGTTFSAPQTVMALTNQLPGGSTNMAAYVTLQKDSDNYYARVWVRDGVLFRSTHHTKGLLVPFDEGHSATQVGLELHLASAGQKDGRADILVNGEIVASLKHLNNPGDGINRVRLGLVDEDSTQGTVYFDHFKSYHLPQLSDIDYTCKITSGPR